MLHNELDKVLEQIRNPDKRNWILMVPNSLGETVTVCGLAKSFIEKHGHGVTLVIPQSHAFIPECFPNAFDRIVYADLGVMRQFNESGYLPPNFFHLDFPINTWPQQNGDGRTYELLDRWIDTVGRSGLNFIDLYRYVLRLDWASKFTLAQVPQQAYAKADKIINNLNLKRGKTVVFFVGGNTNKPAPAYLWEQMAKLYAAQGYDVVINKYRAMFVPEGLSIPDAKIVDLDLEVAIPICEYAGNVVSNTSGFIFFALAASNIDYKMDILLPTEICTDWTSLQFKNINPMAGCHQLIIPELASNVKKLREWIMPVEHDTKIYDEIARGVVFDANYQHAIVRQN